MKRFYKQVSATPVAGEAAFEVLLDGRSVKTPLRRSLHVPGGVLAEAIADEWRSQEEEIDVEAMPHTRIAATALDRAAEDRDGYIDQIAAYAETDLICYRAPSPTELVVRQSRAWEPLLEWSRDTFGAELAVTDGLLPIEQAPGSLARLREAVATHDPFELAALGVATSASGSVIVALALSHGRLDAETAFEVSQLDESYQTEIWGKESEAETRRQVLRAELDCASSFLSLLRAG